MTKSRTNAVARLFCGLAVWILVASSSPAYTPVQRGGRVSDTSQSTFERTDNAAAPDYKEPGFFWTRPREKTAEAQMARARALEAAGSTRKARKAYEALVREWGDAPEAAEAQLKFAQLCEAAGKYERAFREYQYYLEHYAGGRVSDLASYIDIVSSQFGIANALRARVTSPLGPSMETVASMYRHIVDNAPDWERAPDCVFYEALTYEACNALQKAVPVFERLCTKYPASGLVADARYRAAFCRYTLSSKAKNDERSAANALQAVQLARRVAPSHPEAARAGEAAAELSRRLSRMAYEKAEFYDRIRANPKAARIAYEQFLKAYPASEEAEIVRARLAELPQP